MNKFSEYIHQLKGAYYQGDFARILLTLTGHCPNNCYFCPGRSRKKPPEGKMSDELFYKVIADLKEMDYHSELHFYCIGESLLHQNLFHYIEHARKELPKAKLKLISNFVLLDDEKIDKLLDSPLDELVNSIYALSHEDYSKLCRSKNYKKAMTNQIKFLKKFSRRDPIPFEFRVYIIEFPENEHDFEFIEYFLSLLPCNYAGRTKLLDFPDNDAEGPRNATDNVCCDFIYKALVVHSDGSASLCIPDPDANFTVGNVYNDSIVNILDAPATRKMRKELFKARHKLTEKHCRFCSFAINHSELFWLPPSPIKTKLDAYLTEKKGNYGVVMSKLLNSEDIIRQKADIYDKMFPDFAIEEWPDIIDKLRDEFNAKGPDKEINWTESINN